MMPSFRPLSRREGDDLELRTPGKEVIGLVHFHSDKICLEVEKTIKVNLHIVSSVNLVRKI